MRWFLFIFTGMSILVTAHFAYAGLSGSLDEKSIAERLQPEAAVTIEGGSATAQTTASESSKITDIGQQKYEEVCKMCHDTGLAGAPKFGDKGDWSPRISQGMATLVKHAIQGLKAMPPKGGCSACTDEEIQKAVEYMVTHAK